MKVMRKKYRTSPCRAVLLSLLFIWAPAGCSPDTRPMELKQFVKSDVDMVADAMYREMALLMKDLTIKLYLRNPRELKKGAAKTIEERVAVLFDSPEEQIFPELGEKTGIEAVLLCFDDEFQGDRVFALTAGLRGMIRGAYNDREEFFILDSLDQQKLYNSARNLEILVWRLSNKRKENRELFLLTNGMEGLIPNLSFERLFGKMIAIQDMMARIMADRTNRLINRIVISVASASFLP